MFFPTFSPQGDGNLLLRDGVLRLEVFHVFPYFFPARGRKLSQQAEKLTGEECFSLLFPRKGTETPLFLHLLPGES